MIEFAKKQLDLLLIYTPEEGIKWIEDKIKRQEEIGVKHTFTFHEQDVVKVDKKHGSVIFRLGSLEYNDYYKISKQVIGCEMNIFFEKTIRLKLEYFKYPHNNWYRVNIFNKISEVLKDVKNFYIGGNSATISIEDFNGIIKEFPSYYERELYSKARVEQVLEQYFELTTGFNKKFENYRNKKVTTIKNKELTELDNYEKEKYTSILNRLKVMLNEEDAYRYNEKQWQREIAQILLLIFPKYIAFAEEVSIPIETSSKGKRFDFVLITSTGNIDLLEIKRPSSSSVISSRDDDRKNYYPTNSLSKTIMQVEKYLYYLNMLGYKAKDVLMRQKVITEKLPTGLEINNVNAKGLVILGREKDFAQNQIRDFEIIKKMYANIIEIITYDDLIARLENTLKAIEKRGIFTDNINEES